MTGRPTDAWTREHTAGHGGTFASQTLISVTSRRTRAAGSRWTGCTRCGSTPSPPCARSRTRRSPRTAGPGSTWCSPELSPLV
eukprot:5093601-Pyramimonas_sp.AAC.1